MPDPSDQKTEEQRKADEAQAERVVNPDNPPPVDPENPVGQGAQDVYGAPPPPPDPTPSDKDKGQQSQQQAPAKASTKDKPPA